MLLNVVFFSVGIVVNDDVFEIQAQIGLLVILLVAIGDFVIGAFVGPKTDVELARGFTGFNGGFFKQWATNNGHDTFCLFLQPQHSPIIYIAIIVSTTTSITISSLCLPYFSRRPLEFLPEQTFPVI